MIARITERMENGLFKVVDEDNAVSVLTKSSRDTVLENDDFIVGNLLNDDQNEDDFYFEFERKATSEEIENKWINREWYQHLFS